MAVTKMETMKRLIGGNDNNDEEEGEQGAD